ncbi:hypothetical protein APHAL10511_001276 [Amanita phalloides]|nr:hypothetical protein APHAL10511_001276 [Amanita phalloides]
MGTGVTRMNGEIDEGRGEKRGGGAEQRMSGACLPSLTIPLSSMDSPNDLLQHRLAQLKFIAERRDELLREMYHMMCRRKTAGHILALSDQDEEQDLHIFLQRFDLSKHPETGSITSLGENELFACEGIDEYSHVISGEGSVPLSTTQTSDKTEENVVPPAEPEESPPRLDVVPSQPYPRHIHEDDSDDELDFFGPYHRRPTSQPSETIDEPAVTSPEAISIVDDDLADGEGDIDNEEILHDDAFQLQEDNVVEQPDEQMSIDQYVPSEGRRSPDGFDDQGHLSNASEEALSAISAEVDDTMDVQPDLVPKTPMNELVFPKFSYPSDLTYSPLPNKVPRPIFVLGPISPLKAYNYAFNPESNLTQLAKGTEPSITPTLLRSGPHTKYSLPPLKSLPIEYSRKNRSKQRKRDKEREKNDAKRDNNDWIAMGLNKWAATINANPIWKKVARATKCLSSREWAVAMGELRLVRAVGRIEFLKDGGRWSFRQPKKQRGVGGLVKTHWDYLLDEMKWMRVDFREERKWKMALAYNLSTSVLEWHAAGSWSERFAKGITVRWKRPLPDKIESDECLAEEPMPSKTYQPDQDQKISLLGLDYGSDDDDDDEQDREVVDALQPSALLEDALDIPTGIAAEVEDNSIVTQLKKEEMEDQSALGASQDTPQSDGTGGNHESNEVVGLKSTSNDPMWGSASQSGERDIFPCSTKQSSKANVYAPVRERIAYSDEQKLFLSLADLHLDDSSMAQNNENKDELFPPVELSTIFPDLQPLEMLDVARVITSSQEGRKKSEKRSDKDDPNKRIEDTTYSKLFPASQFMRKKPTLLGPLLPSKRWKDGSWAPIEEAPVAAEADGVRANEEQLNELFENRTNNAAAAFWQAAAMKERDPRRKSAEHVWTTNDDALLKSCIDKYPYNWYLIAECFNASRVTISTDKRTPRDCLDRWREKWGSELRLRQTEASATPATEGPGTPSMMTRGVKRQANVSVATPTSGVAATGVEPRKRRRHMLMQDTIRKYAKKRIETLQKANAQRKPSIIHETHGQYAKLPKLSPAELIRLKAERDAREHQEILARKRHVEELGRQVMQARLSQQQQQQQQQQGQVAQPGSPRAGRGQVNISQQQRLGGSGGYYVGGMSAEQLSRLQMQAGRTGAERLV